MRKKYDEEWVRRRVESLKKCNCMINSITGVVLRECDNCKKKREEQNK